MVRSPYPPLFLALDGALTTITGPSLAPGRLLALGAILATAGVLFAIVRKATDSWVYGALAVTLLCGSPHLYEWTGFGRVDTLAMAFSLGGIAAMLGPQTKTRAVLAGGLCVLALLTKQAAVAAPLAIVGFLAFQNRRLLPVFLAALIVPLAAATVALTLFSSGYYIDHVVLGNATNPFSAARLLYFEIRFFGIHALLLGVGVLYLTRYRRELPAWYLAASFISSLSVGNAGSSVAYLHELLVGLILAAAYATRHFEQHFATSAWPARGLGAGNDLRRAAFPYPPLIPIFLAVLQLALLFHLPNRVGVWPSEFPPNGFTPTAGDYAVGQRLDAILDATPGEVIAEPAALALRHHREVLIQPIDLRAEEIRGRWSPAQLSAALVAQRFSLVILSFGFLPDSVWPSLEAGYELDERLTGDNQLTYSVYRPRAGSPVAP